MKCYLSDKQCLSIYHQKATPDFWDKHWESSELGTFILSCTDDKNFIPLIKKYLPVGSTVLEGGCGQGHLVHALQFNGYKAIGIDFAKKTIHAIKKAVPELDVRIGDVRNLPIMDDELDGYISAGVIEHFWEGYESIIREIRRTIKLGGYLFISFPYMSPLRKLKLFFRMYPIYNKFGMDKEKENFYQFALQSTKVIKDIENKGFKLIERITYDGIKGCKDEVKFLRTFLQKIYDGKTHQEYRKSIDNILKLFSSHMMLLVMRKAE